MVELVLAGGDPKELAKEFGCHVTSIQSWMRAAGIKQSSGTVVHYVSNASGSLTDSERQELQQLRKKLKQVEMERDILAKATAWFANNKA